MLRATISTPEELRTGPAVGASTLMWVRRPDNRPAISNAEIGPAASSSWNSGKIRIPTVPIMTPISTSRHSGRAMSKNEGIKPFMT